MSGERLRNTIRNYMKRFQSYFLTGILVITPFLVTFVILDWVYRSLDVPVRNWLKGQSEGWVPSLIPGLGVVVTIIALMGLGLFAQNYLGHRIIALFDRILDRIPMVRRVYSGAKQVSSVLFQENRKVFQSSVLVEYPRKGIWTLAFLTNEDIPRISHTIGRECACVFVATTPNPTSGFLIMVPKEDIVPLNLSIEDAVKIVFSAGAFTPEQAAQIASQTAPKPWRFGRKPRPGEPIAAPPVSNAPTTQAPREENVSTEERA